MNKKWLLFMTLGLILTLVVSALPGCDTTNSIESNTVSSSQSPLAIIL
jgi:hypothetical protein